MNDNEGGFAVRAITRDAKSDKAISLAKMSAEVVEENVDDKESLKKAFDGAYGAYCVETATGSTVHIQRVEDSNHQEVRPLLLL